MSSHPAKSAAERSEQPVSGLTTSACSICEDDDCSCPENEELHCATCRHITAPDGYCGHCVALGDGNPYQ